MSVANPPPTPLTRGSLRLLLLLAVVVTLGLAAATLLGSMELRTAALIGLRILGVIGLLALVVAIAAKLMPTEREQG